jgi:two-component system sensor histidine kinase QseC
LSAPSLQRRIVLALLVTAPVLWILATAVALYQSYGEVNELYDGQLVLMAHQLLRSNRLDSGGGPPALQDDERRRAHRAAHGGPGKRRLGAGWFAGMHRHDSDTDEFSLTQAMWDRDGTLLLSDGPAGTFGAKQGDRGFSQLESKGEVWRVFVLRSHDGERTVSVGQKMSMRREMAWQVVSSQLLAWLLPLPLLLLALVLAVRRGLAPLKVLADRLARRRADDRSPITDQVPAEALPLVQALNQLFERVSGTLEHERRFTADAAHELRTPLAALRVQTEVAQLAQDPAILARALVNLGIGVDRATRLIDQLLALSRLDPMDGLKDALPISWRQICERAVQDMAPLAAQRQVSLSLQWRDAPEDVLPLCGDETLLALMLRNLLENALRYTQKGGEVTLECSSSALCVLDNGPGVAVEWLDSIRQRFFRPPGQAESGSGLGLSIVERIAGLHRLRLELENRAEGGFCSRIIQ